MARSVPVALSTDIDFKATRQILLKKIEKFILSKKSIPCKTLNGRKVSLAKFIEANKGRRQTLQRLQGFFSAIETIKRATEAEPNPKFPNEYQLRGLTPSKSTVIVHIREESHRGKNRKLFMISCFWK